MKESNWCAFDYDGGVADSYLNLPASLDRTYSITYGPAGSGDDLSVLLRRAIPTLTLRRTRPTCLGNCRPLRRYHRSGPFHQLIPTPGLPERIAFETNIKA
jgi:hypothetical protein